MQGAHVCRSVSSLIDEHRRIGDLWLLGTLCASLLIPNIVLESPLNHTFLGSFITEAARDKMDGEGLRLTDYAARWRGLSEAEKKVYVDRAAKDIAEYQEKKAAKAGDA